MKKQTERKIKRLARSIGFDDAKYLGDVDGFTVYTPSNTNGLAPRIGKFIMIVDDHVSEPKIVSGEEWFWLYEHLVDMLDAEEQA